VASAEGDPSGFDEHPTFVPFIAASFTLVKCDGRGGKQGARAVVHGTKTADTWPLREVRSSLPEKGACYTGGPSAFANTFSAEVAQLVEHVTENHGVGGSIPSLGTIITEYFHKTLFAGLSGVTWESRRDTPLPPPLSNFAGAHTTPRTRY
jgi:hypothetical protein